MKIEKIDLYFLLIIFSLSFLLRMLFFQGFVLCDDIQEFSTPLHFLTSRPDFHDAFHLRFILWGTNWIFFKIFGVSEFSFFLPTLLMSSSMPLLAYLIIRKFGYSSFHSLLISLFVASSPFEIMIGTLRANDLIFAWFVYLAFLTFLLFEKKPEIQGIMVGILLWFAFYVKLWAVYFILVFLIFYVRLLLRKKEYKSLIYFFLTSLVLHALIGIFWVKEVGIFFPFLKYHSATYPIPNNKIFELWTVYPTYIFKGSFISTTLFGLVPYFLLAFLLVKLVLFWKKKIKIDELDFYLFPFYFIFFMLLNFLPDTPLKFDQYYSVPRIFRYLYPISFPMSLHAGKMIVDIFISLKFKKEFQIFLFLFLIVVNLVYACEATLPGRIYREDLLSMVEDIKRIEPPIVLSESWIGFFLERVYLKDTKIIVKIVPNIFDAKEYESWLKENEKDLPDKTLLIANFGSCVHYGCYNCGFQLSLFKEKTLEKWKLLKEYKKLEYSPLKQVPAIWILNKESYQ